ncbi:glycosyltransferase family 4 protein [Flavivirga jejuensis]|uniref:Glycosyltransferase family 4 protein n=1 Tax=Flavivirga jejuensis TaxID=870487 RepID=A0ABT8WTF1_9FLAO|nr:glycosyltransferase family 4 protein [Flavivirga jejuensis]MDO5976379.1 glycosyltransferase family 4 protein [Flavivirga jejuensis]
MAIKILYILPSFNKFGGTPKKTLDLIKHAPNECYLYVWTNAYAKEFKDDFIQSGAKIFVGDHKRNILKHISNLLKIIDTYNIEIIQSQFFFGELLAGILKILRPKVKLIVAFVGSLSPSGYRKKLLNILYNKVDTFIYISEYVKTEKIKIYPKLKHSKGLVIYNGTNKPNSIKHNILNKEQGTINILCVSGLSKIKNVQVLIDCMVILLEKNYDQIQFLIAGDGPEKENFEKQLLEKHLSKNFKLLGYQKNIGDLYNRTNIFAHPCYVEGFGIAVAEAMVEEKPIIVSNAGALPELIKNNETGLLVNAFDAQQWADAIIKLIENPDLANKLAKNAKLYAETQFSVKRFVEDYNKLYKNLMN